MTIRPSWQKLLQSEFEKNYFQELMNTVAIEYESTICYPPKELLFSAFNQFEFADLKVVIIGQDPYHGEGEANGCVFRLMMELQFRLPYVIFSEN